MKSIVIFLLVGASAFAAVKNNILDEVSSSYQKAPMIEMSVKKTVHSELLGSDKIIEGKMTTGNGLFRWESEKPEKALIVYDGEYLWNVQYPSPDFGGDTQATKSQINKTNRSQILPALILSSEPIKNHFDVLDETKEKNVVIYKLKAKSKDFVFQNLVLVVDLQTKTIKQISYKDEVGSTTFEFLKTEKQNNFSKQPFTYKPGPDVKVTTL